MTNTYDLMAILAFKFILIAFLAYFLKVLDSSSREVDSEEVDGKGTNGKVVYGKDIGNKKTGSKKVRGFLADFALSIFLLSTKFYKERFGIYFLKLY